MPHRHTPSSVSPLELRGVYEAEYKVRGKVYCYSINSRAELHGERLVAADAPRWKVESAIASLWTELNREDPIALHDRPPFLRLE